MLFIWFLSGDCISVELIVYDSYLQTEMMSDAIDDALDNDEAEEETEDLTNQVNSLNWFSLLFFFLATLLLVQLLQQ